MKLPMQPFPAGHLVISVMFIVNAFALLAFAVAAKQEDQKVENRN